jgi:hypothetical protein
MGYAVKTMMSLNAGSGSQPVAAGTTPTALPTPTPATGSATPSPAATPTPTSTAAPTLAGSPTPAVAAPAGGTIPGGANLVAAVKPAADAGQLQSFSLFETKDPFSTNGPKVKAAVPTGPSSGSGGGTKPAKPPVTPPAPPMAPPTTAVITVNGTTESVASGANFPAAKPLFQLVSLTETTAKVAVAGGSYANGAPTLTLTVNKPVTLVNTADGTRYTLTLLPQGTQATASGSSTSPGSTTPSSSVPGSSVPGSTTPMSTTKSGG